MRIELMEQTGMPGLNYHTLDLRKLPQDQRCLKVLEAFESMGASSRFILITDTNPDSLCDHLLKECPGRITWEFLDQGPEVWRILITKKE